MAANNMNNLTTLIKRLEAATSRLEDMAQATLDSTTTANGTKRSGAPEKQRGVSATSQHAKPPARQPETLPPSINAFDELVSGDVTTFVNISNDLGGVVAEQASEVLKAFRAQRKILIIASRAKKPDVQSPLYMEILTELQRHMGIVNNLRETNRASQSFNHLTAVSEGIAALGWIAIEPNPVDFIAEVLGSAQFYGNRVIKEYKERERKHADWVQSFYGIFKVLASYVKQHHPRGLMWNNKDGIDAREALQQAQSGQIGSTTSAPQASGGPPPPPPPPLPTFDNGATPSKTPARASGGGGDMEAVFSQLNQGEAVTSGLRKVDRSEMTHKNPSLRAGSTVPTRSDSQTSMSSASRGKSPAPPGKKPKPENMRTKKPPRKELDGNKWVIENYESESQPIQIQAQISQSIIISRCSATTIQVVGKANAISIDNCPRLSLIIDSLVSSVDIVKSSRFAMQVLGSLPTILLDQVDGATVYLGPRSQATELFTSKCSSVNVNIPSEGNGDEVEDYAECPLPEQIKSYIKNGKMVSEIVDHAG